MASTPLEFARLTAITFWKLPKLKSFYPGTLSCPSLTNLSVDLCDNLEPFRTDQEIKPVFLPEQVIYDLKYMEIQSRDAEWLKCYIGNYRMHKLEEFCISKLVDTTILYFFLHRNPNLKSLVLNYCFFEELVPRGRHRGNENLGVVPKLKSLKLVNLPFLKKIGFERDTVLQRIEFLILQECPRLITIAPSSVSFTSLTNLEVINCHRLIYLMAPSTAKSLVQLTTMKVTHCRLMKEIVAEQGSEEEEKAGDIDIVFRQLKEIELLSLGSLTSFCSSKSCSFEFPSLEKLVVTACLGMQRFSERVSTPILRRIYVVHRKEEQRWYYWEGDLNKTIEKLHKEKIFYEGVEDLTVPTHLDLLEVWHNEVGLQDNHFYSLKTLMLDNCHFQPHAIGSNVLPYLKNLKELQVLNCCKVEPMFDINDTEMKGTAFLLKKLTLVGLPNLKHVWDDNRQGIDRFQNLQEVIVTDCENLKTLFPAALAKNLKKLEKLDISHCRVLQEIVGKEAAAAAAAEATELLLFPRLTTLDLYMLPQLSCVFPETETFTLECPELNYLLVLCCGESGLLQGGTSANGKPRFLEHKVISNLETLTLNRKDTDMVCNAQFPEDAFHKLNQLVLCFDDVNHVPSLPFKFLEKAPNLEDLAVMRCSGLREIFPVQELEVGKNKMLGRLKTLYLFELPELNSIGLESLWLKRFCEKLHSLYVSSCPRLTRLVHSAVSFSNLKELIVENCHGLECLFTSSTAEKLMHLEEMHIVQCGSMKEILAEEQGEATSIEIKFDQLKTIVLDSLPSLVCFYSGDFTLQLPSLIQVNIWQCPKMKIFSRGLIGAKSFRGVTVSLDPNDDLFFHQDLNATVERLPQQQAQLVLGDHPHLVNIWLGDVPAAYWCFCNLKHLVVEGCEFLSNAILPSHILPSLSNLEVMEVQNCDNVKAIFDVKDTPPLSLPLKKLTLVQLSILEHVWNGDPLGSLSLPFLEEVLVERCESIRSLFPASVAKDKLQKLDVKYCEGLVEMVARDEAATEHAIKELIIFPSVTSLRLWDLPNLKCICPGMHNLEWPMLKELDIYHCEMLKIFAAEFQNCPDSHPEGQDQDRFPADHQAFVSVEKVIPRLEQLSLNREDTMMIEKGQIHVDLQATKFLKLQCFHDESDAFPYVFLSKVPLPSIEKLWVIDSTFKEIFPSRRPDIDYTKILSRLKGLVLDCLSMLNSIGLEASWLGPFPGNLETLAVLDCRCLKSLAPSTVSFSHLTELIVGGCDGLKYLFTSSTAKSLGLLNKMQITNCVSIAEVVAKEGDEAASDEIKFERLHKIVLDSLSSLVCFYSGDFTLQLPSLIEVNIWHCPKMKIFSHGLIHAKSFKGIGVSSDPNDDLLFHHDLNATVERLSQQQARLVLGDHPKLKDIWLGEVPVPYRCFCNLKYLVVKRCEFLSNAILPPHILPSLSNLEVMEVQNCNNAKAIFDVKDTLRASPLTLPLKKLSLLHLPNLEHVWNEDPQGSLSLPFLEEVLVDECDSVRSLFPASVARDKLRKLHVQNCEGLVEIVAKDEAAGEEAIKELIIFPSITSLRLWDLPNLKRICPGMHNLEWPMLKELDVCHCEMLKIFAAEFQNCPDSRPEGQGRFPTDRQAFVSVEKVIPRLEQLSLNREDTMMIEQGQIHVDLQATKFLKLQCFHDELDAFPYVFLSKVPLPSIEKLWLVDSTFKEIFPSRRPDIDCTKILSRLKRLVLDCLSMLNSIGLEARWLGPFPGNLETLAVSACDCLKHLAPSTVYFSHLTELIVRECDGLEYLFTSSTAKSLRLLNKMQVTNCGSIEEIVDKDGDEPEEDEMVFGQLKILSLSFLPKLESFYTGSSTLNFPSLEQISFTQCHSMKIFCHGDVVPKKLRGQIDGVYWHGDLNTVMKRQFGEGSSLS